MNSNQSKKLTPKQTELVKRLERIRRNKDSAKEDLTKDASKERAQKAQPRNKNIQQERKESGQKRESFSRPTEGQTERNQRKESPYYDSNRRKNLHKAKKKKTVMKKKKKSKSFMNQLSDGNSLSQAIILSEILDKPVSLRKK